MPLTDFDHVNIRTANLEAMLAWYGDVLGLHAGARPASRDQGAWLYLGGRAVIHLVEVDQPPMPGESLGIEHVSFRATGLTEFLKTLETAGVPHHPIKIDSLGLTLINIYDPDGNHLHIDFPTDEVSG